MIIASTVCLVLFGILAIIDGVYYHDIKYKLYKDKESILEHIYHTIRAVMFPFMMYCFFARNFGGWLLILGVTAASLDLIMLLFDVKEEGRSRGGRQGEGGIEEEQKRGRCGAEEGVVLRTVPPDRPHPTELPRPRQQEARHPNTDTHGGEIGRRYGL